MTQPTQLTAEHIARIIELRDHLIEQGPDRFDMSNWFTITETTESVDTMTWDELMHQLDDSYELLQHGCGTAACIAGHAALLWADELRHTTMTIDVARLLGMDVGVEPWQAEIWFAVSAWPTFAFARWVAGVHAEPPIDYRAEDYAEQVLAVTFARRRLQHEIVIDVMDDLIHGRRLHWYDDDTSAADRADLVDAQEV